MQAPLKQLRRFSRWKIASKAAAGEGTNSRAFIVSVAAIKGTDDDAILDMKFLT